MEEPRPTDGTRSGPWHRDLLVHAPRARGGAEAQPAARDCIGCWCLLLPRGTTAGNEPERQLRIGFSLPPKLPIAANATRRAGDEAIGLRLSLGGPRCVGVERAVLTMTTKRAGDCVLVLPCGLTFELSRPWRQGGPADKGNMLLRPWRPGCLAGAGRLERRVRRRLRSQTRSSSCSLRLGAWPWLPQSHTAPRPLT